MGNNKDELFKLLKNILAVVKDINIMTQNQETIILHGSAGDMLSQLSANKQELILKLDKLEDQFQTAYEQDKEAITSSQDVERLQAIVGEIVETKGAIAQGEEKNRRLWASKEAPKVNVEPVRQPKSYVIDQYKKHSTNK